MTVSSQTASIEYSGNGITLAFAIPFNFLSDADIQVCARDVGGDSAILDSGFSVTGAGSGSGTCTFIVAPDSGIAIRIERAPSLLQQVEYTPNGAFPALAHETALDSMVYQMQYLRELLKRCVQFPAGDAAIASGNAVLGGMSARLGKFIGFDPTDGSMVLLGAPDLRGTTDAGDLIAGTLADARLSSKVALTRRASKATATSRSSTDTLAADPDLAVELEAHRLYKFECVVRYKQSSGGVGNQGFSATIGYTGTQVAVTSYQASMGVHGVTPDPTYAEALSDSITHYQATSTTTAAYGDRVEITGFIETTSVGTLGLYWAQTNSQPQASTVLPGSTLILTQMA